MTDGYGEFTQWYVFDGSSLLAEVNASDGQLSLPLSVDGEGLGVGLPPHRHRPHFLV